MAQKDIAEKILEDFPDVFSDIVNVLLFDGEEVVKPESLRDSLARSAYKADGGLHEQERDVAKCVEVDGVIFAMIGFENQSVSERPMPLRMIGYDGASYRKQLKDIGSVLKKNAEIMKSNRAARKAGKPTAPLLKVPKPYPVITVVLYFGLDPWKYSPNLTDCLEIKDVYRPYVNEYKLNLFEIAFLPDETIEKFKSDFKEVARFFSLARRRKQGEDIPDSAFWEAFDLDHIEETLDLLVAFTGDKNLRQDYFAAAQEGGVSMSEFFDKVFSREFAEKNKKLAEQFEKIAERDDKIAKQDEKLAEQFEKIAERDEKIAEQDEKIAEQDEKIAEQDNEINSMRSLIEKLQRENALLKEASA